ncbi:hypothetical protein B0H19DRAFT_1139995 [Mycena capillaripes]|nr:hypothetical protein B0H19DRAFT_1139995 [Mycena capillaripes]
MSTPSAPPIAYPYLLPAELWLACWTLCSLRQLRRISLVCALFRSHTLPLLLQHQTLDLAKLEQTLNPKNWTDHLHHLHRAAVRLDRLRDSPYALLVRSWKAAFGGHPTYHKIRNVRHFDLLKVKVITTFSATLTAYRNLSSLSLQNVIIDASFRESLRSLSKLEDLQLSGCRIVRREGFLPLKRFQIAYEVVTNEEPLQMASPDTLRILHSESHIFRLIKGFGQQILRHLVDLTIRTERDFDTLFIFLKQCPHLESLAINAPNVPLTLPSIHPHTVQRLRALTAPPKLHELLTPNRPVSAATVLKGPDTESDADYLIHICVDISRSSVPLNSLVLPPVNPTLEFMVAITSLFPDLRALSMEVLGMTPARQGFGRNVNYRHIPVPSVDLPLPDLSDDDAAFCNLPAEEISDDEADNLPPIIVIRRSTAPSWETYTDKFRIMLGWIFTGELELPHTIEVLCFKMTIDSLRRQKYEGLSLKQQIQAISALSGIYPRLREVKFPLRLGSWKRNGDDLWESEREVSWLRVLP